MQENKALSTRLNKYLDYLTPGKKVELTPLQQERFELMSKVHHWLANWLSPVQVVRRLEESYNLKKSQAYEIIKDSNYIFGEFGKLSKEAWRAIQIELVLSAAQTAKRATGVDELKKAEIQLKAVAELQKLTGTNNHGVEIDPEKLMPTINIVFTTEPRPNEVIDIDVEEAT